MTKRWTRRPEGSNWGDFGEDDQLGRLNLLTAENTRKAAEEIKQGLRFCLSLPLDIPATNATNARRLPPELKPIVRDGHVAFGLPLGLIHEGFTDVNSDEAMVIYSQHSTQWDSFAHMGSMFDPTGEGGAKPLAYNGYSVFNENGEARQGKVGAWNLGIEHMARQCVQGRGVLVDLVAHFGRENKAVGYDDLMRVLEADGVEIEEGDIACLYTGYADVLIEQGEDLDPELPTKQCPALDGWDDKLLKWIDDSGISVLASDNRAVEYEYGRLKDGIERGPGMPIHELCLFKLGIHLGEMWYFAEISRWLKANGRYRFFVTAPPLHVPGAVGSPANPIGTV
ncbi:MAG: cyclase family protein [Alphaproteobacteria bacterium]|nr:cyclase family protein [Alphaproteobacteria bacterium]